MHAENDVFLIVDYHLTSIKILVIGGISSI